MKRVIAILVMILFAVSFSFAQSDTAKVTQNAQSSQALISQTLGASNFAEATQTGMWNFANVDQQGSTNRATIVSTGNSNSVDFAMPHDFFVPNSALSYTGGLLGLGVTQYGTSNNATVTQNGDFNWALVGQFADGNSATITQTEGDLMTSNYAGVNQKVGTGNISEQIQSAVDAESYILQTGSTNFAHVEQYQNIGGLYYGGLAEVVQDGSNNNAVQSQTGSAVAYDGTSVQAKIYQVGTNNYAVQNQNGGGNVSLITSIGNNNGVPGDEIKTDQTGEWNTATIEQGLLGAVNSNMASIIQTCSFSTANISQEAGDGNSARITQQTDSDIAQIFQSGVSNIAEIMQH